MFPKQRSFPYDDVIATTADFTTSSFLRSSNVLEVFLKFVRGVKAADTYEEGCCGG